MAFLVPNFAGHTTVKVVSNFFLKDLFQVYLYYFFMIYLTSLYEIMFKMLVCGYAKYLWYSGLYRDLLN